MHALQQLSTLTLHALPLRRGHGGSRQRMAAGGSIGADASATRAVAQAALTAVLAVLEACVGGGSRPLADPAASGFYFTMMKSLRLLVSEVRGIEVYSSHV